MKVFKVYADKWDYDDYDACIVVAESEEAVRKMLVKDGDNYTRIDGPTTYCCFGDWQGEIHIEEVGLTKQDVILASFNAG